MRAGFGLSLIVAERVAAAVLSGDGLRDAAGSPW
jgi:hypothetical protein